MKKMGFFVFSILLVFCCVGNVNATEVVTDPSNNIEMPYNLFVDKTNYINFKNADSATKSYQIINVTNNKELVNKINTDIIPELETLYENEVEFGKYEAGTTESNNINSNIQLIKATIDEKVKRDDIKTLVDNYNDANWVTLSENTIPTTGVEKNNYYVVWVKVQNNNDTTYDYHVYKAMDSNYYSNNADTKVENPDTGIEHTLLFVGVGALLIIGSSLVINKNKESY